MADSEQQERTRSTAQHDTPALPHRRRAPGRQRAGGRASASGFFARQAKSLPATAIRPPGALPEDEFNGACIRCGLCVRDCPFDMIHLAGSATRSPPARRTSPRAECRARCARTSPAWSPARPMPSTSTSQTSTRRAWGLRSWSTTRTASPFRACAARSATRSARSRTRPSPSIASTTCAPASTPCSSRWSTPSLHRLRQVRGGVRPGAGGHQGPAGAPGQGRARAPLPPRLGAEAEGRRGPGDTGRRAPVQPAGGMRYEYGGRGLVGPDDKGQQ